MDRYESCCNINSESSRPKRWNFQKPYESFHGNHFMKSSFKFLGHSHCCDQDDKKIMDLINMKVYDPYETETTNFKSMVDEWIMDSKAAYLRV